MKNPMHRLLAIAGLSLAIGFTACKSLKPNTGQEEYDVVKTEQVKDIIEPVAIGIVRRVIQKNPETSPWFSRAAKTFAYMRDTKQLDPAVLIKELDQAATEEGWFDPTKPWMNEAIDSKNALIALYKTYYNQRLIADLPEDQFLYHLADFFSDVISRGVTEAGQSVSRKRTRAMFR